MLPVFRNIQSGSEKTTPESSCRILSIDDRLISDVTRAQFIRINSIVNVGSRAPSDQCPAPCLSKGSSTTSTTSMTSPVRTCLGAVAIGGHHTERAYSLGELCAIAEGRRHRPVVSIAWASALFTGAFTH